MKNLLKKIIIVFILVSIVATTSITANGNSLTQINITPNSYAEKSVTELISIIENVDNYADVDLSCISALNSKATKKHEALFERIIFDNNEKTVLRKALMEICIHKNLSLDKDNLLNLLWDKNQDLSLRRFVMDYCFLQKDEYLADIENIIQSNESGLVYRAMKKLPLISPEKALMYAEQKMNFSDIRIPFEAKQAAIEIIADKLYKHSTKEERIDYINKCDTLLSKTTDPDKCQLILSTISSVQSEETFVYVMESKKLSDLTKLNIVNYNQPVIKRLQNSDIADKYSNVISVAEFVLSEKNLQNLVNNYNPLRTTDAEDEDTDKVAGLSILSNGGFRFGHAGLMYRNGFDANNGVDTIIHINQSFEAILYGNESDFLNGNAFLGYYRPRIGLNLNSRGNVIVTAFYLYLRTESINYSLLHQIDYSYDANGNEIVDISEIENMRCDGFVEYCYEYNGIPIFINSDNVDKWNISLFDEETKALHSNTHVVPKIQAYEFMTNMLGDIDADGSVTARDAQLVMQYTTGGIDFNQYQHFVANVDIEEDNDAEDEITIAEARLILRYSTGLEDHFPNDPFYTDTIYRGWRFP